MHSYKNSFIILFIIILLLFSAGCRGADMAVEEPAAIEEPSQPVKEVQPQETIENLVRRSASDRLPGSLNWGSIIIFKAGEDFLIDHPEGLKAVSSVSAELEAGGSGTTSGRTESAAAEKPSQKPAETATQPAAASGSSSSEHQSIHWNNGIYVGPLRNGVPHGQGKLIVPGGLEYTGAFQEGSMTGYGTMIFISGVKHVGLFKDGLAHGQGTMTHPDGRSISGTWSNGNFIE